MYKSSAYSKEQTAEWEGRIAIILADEVSGLTIPEIQEKDVCLAGISAQKMARMLNHLVEFGLAGKSKGKSGRMIYYGLSQ